LTSAVACGFAQTVPSTNPTTDGYRGIWFALGQRSEHGDKYSGGLATYTANHVPIAIHSAKANKTFFVYGGTTPGKRQQLQIMASYFDHATGNVPRPTIVHDKKGVNDPHDNGSIAIDAAGHVWVFVSGRARTRPGFIYRSTAPLSVAAFEQLAEREMTYPQPWFIGGKRGLGVSPEHSAGGADRNELGRDAQATEGAFVFLFTKYTKGRELYWQTSGDGYTWRDEKKLAGFGGHYQVSGVAGEQIGSAFMWHPSGNVDARTNLYYVQTRDRGETWTTADRKWLSKLPLTGEQNDALVVDYRAQKLNVYIHDLNFDRAGRPAILYLTSRGHQPGPDAGPRVWRVTRFDGAGWRTRDVCESDHAYDTGALFVDDGDRWTIVGPTLMGPQPHGTGGDIAFWSSADAGRTWRETRTLTRDSRFNHSYVRRVVNGVEPFRFLWADGDPDQQSESRLYFGGMSERYHELPYEMPGDFAAPIEHAP
jgi:hypothetical protein